MSISRKRMRKGPLCLESVKKKLKQAAEYKVVVQAADFSGVRFSICSWSLTVLTNDFLEAIRKSGLSGVADQFKQLPLVFYDAMEIEVSFDTMPEEIKTNYFTFKISSNPSHRGVKTSVLNMCSMFSRWSLKKAKTTSAAVQRPPSRGVTKVKELFEVSDEEDDELELWGICDRTAVEEAFEGDSLLFRPWSRTIAQIEAELTLMDHAGSFKCVIRNKPDAFTHKWAQNELERIDPEIMKSVYFRFEAGSDWWMIVSVWSTSQTINSLFSGYNCMGYLLDVSIEAI